MKIRSATKKDKKSISELYYELHPEEKEKGKPIPIEKSKIKLILLVAEENNLVVGFIWAHLIQYGFFKYGTIDELFVKKEFRRKGIGSALLREAIKKLQNFKPRLILSARKKGIKRRLDCIKGLDLNWEKRVYGSITIQRRR